MSGPEDTDSHDTDVTRTAGSATTVPRVGIIGGGQLARMLAEAAGPLGIDLTVLAASGDEGASQVVVDVMEGSPTDAVAIRSLAEIVDVVTIDHENVDWETLEELEAAGVAVRPSVRTLRISDKAIQRQTFAALDLPVPPFVVVDPVGGSGALASAERFFEEHAGVTGRIVAKSSRGGYDGRGVWMLDAGALAGFIEAYDGAPLVLEPMLQLDMELAVLVARNPSGQTLTWPVVETIQVDGMCDEVIMPAAISPDLAVGAERIALRIADAVDLVGVLAVELFISNGELLINEIAPRVHNSGHLTIEANMTSQFEQHLRAILDWPLGPTEMVDRCAVMHNVVGGRVDPRTNQAAGLELVPGAHIHLYGKTPRPARKLGHVTVVGDDVLRCRSRAVDTAAALTGDL